MSLVLSQKAQLLKPSPTLAMAAKAKELAAKGHKVISLTVGEPDWPTFAVAAKAGIAAIEEGFTKYTVAHGIIELRQAIAESTQKQTGVMYSSADVVVGSGAKYVIFAALQMLLNPGDEVIIPTPYWVSYPTMVELASGVPKIVECSRESKFKLSPQKLQEAITPKTKAIILCSPSNPTGISYTQEELKALAAVLKKNPNVFIISDDIYNRLTFKDELVSPHLLNVDASLKEQMLVVNGASKAYSMTGWRVGWGLGPKNLITAMADFISQSTSNVASPAQKAALAALTHGEPEVLGAVVKLKQKKSWWLDQFKQLKNFEVIEPDGAFYFWVNVEKLFGQKEATFGELKNSKDVANVLLEKYFLATVPGIEFGCEGYLRLSFAASEANLAEAIVRLKQFEAALS